MLLAFTCQLDGKVIHFYRNGLLDEAVSGGDSGWTDFLHPESIHAATAFLETIRTAGSAFQEFHFITPDFSNTYDVVGYKSGDEIHILAAVSSNGRISTPHAVDDSSEATPAEKTPKLSHHSDEVCKLLLDLPTVLPDVLQISDLTTGKIIFQNRDLDFLNPPQSSGLLNSNELLDADIHPHDRQNLEEYLRTIHNLPCCQTREIEFRTREADQHWHWYVRRDTRFSDNSDSSQCILSHYQDINNRRLSQLKLIQMSIRDPLTDLYNRIYFDQELERLQQSRQFPITILIADVDGLKAINDALGHSSGDKLLRRAAEVLRKAFRNEDVVARLGGDEFGVILAKTSEQDLPVVLKRIQSILHEYNQDLTQIEILMSIGTATAQKGEQLVQTLREADLKMYRNKSERKANGLLSLPPA